MRMPPRIPLVALVLLAVLLPPLWPASVASAPRAGSAAGTPLAWGRNDFGQLGDGSRTERWLPVGVGTLRGVVALAAGQSHGLALLTDGTVWAWGANNTGQLGDGTVATRY